MRGLSRMLSALGAEAPEGSQIESGQRLPCQSRPASPGLAGLGTHVLLPAQAGRLGLMDRRSDWRPGPR